MPHGVYSVLKHRDASKSRPTGTDLAVRIITRIRRDLIDRQLAGGTGAATDAELADAQLALRARQLRSSAERARIANALVNALGDARRAEPVTLRPRPQRAAVREAADDIHALVLRLRDARPVDVRGVAMAARLADDRMGPMYRDDAGDLKEAIRSALSALETTREPAVRLQAQAA